MQPGIQASRDRDGDAIRFGLGAIKNVGSTAVESIVNARNTKGRFTSLYQFCEEVDMQAIKAFYAAVSQIDESMPTIDNKKASANVLEKVQSVA